MSNYQVHEKLLSQKAIREGIWQAIKTKTNYDLAITDSKTKTGGIFTDSIWLKDNYTKNGDSSVQNVVGKLIDISNNSTYITADVYNTILSNKTSTTITGLSATQIASLGIPNGTELNRLPLIEAKTVSSKLIYEDAKLLSYYNQLIDSEIADEIRTQKLFLSGVDVINVQGSTVPSSATSTIYKYDNESTSLTYNISNNKFTISTSSSLTYTYYPDVLILKMNKSSQRYTVSQQNITAIDGVNLTEPITIDFEYVPEYTLTRIERNTN